MSGISTPLLCNMAAGERSVLSPNVERAQVGSSDLGWAPSAVTSSTSMSIMSQKCVTTPPYYHRAFGKCLPTAQYYPGCDRYHHNVIGSLGGVELFAYEV